MLQPNLGIKNLPYKFNYRGLPKSLIEAMASGCACISSDVGECKNVLKKCGIIIQHKNVMETTNALLKLINNNKISEIYSEKSKKIAKKLFLGKLFKYSNKCL